MQTSKLCVLAMISSMGLCAYANPNSPDINLLKTKALTGHMVDSLKNNGSQLSNSGSSVNFSTMTVGHYKTLDNSEKTRYAKQWRMTTNEFTKFLWVKSDTSVGYLYGDVKQDPNILMALYSMQSGDKKAVYHYIENGVRNEHDSIKQLVDVQNIYQKMAQRLYPNETPIKLLGEKPSSYVSYGNAFTKMLKQHQTIVDGAKYILFIDAKHPNQSLSSDVQKMINKLLTAQDVRLDVYDMSQASNQQIIAWAKQMQISPSLINGGVVTLNIGDQFVPLFEKNLGQSIAPGVIFKNLNGHYQRIKWSDFK